jgi:hypothetical protein
VLQKTVVKPTTASAARVSVTACAYNSDGRMMAAGLLDGTVQVRCCGRVDVLVCGDFAAGLCKLLKCVGTSCE